MKHIFGVLLLLSILFLLGCSLDDDFIVEQIITADVVQEPPIGDFIVEKIVEEEIITVKLCHDTDNGIIRWAGGSVFGFYNDSERFEFDDHCFDQNTVIEYYCEDEEPKNTSFLCKSGCVNAHCI